MKMKMKEPDEQQAASDVAGRNKRMVMLPMPETMTRPETSVMQFGDDWPGVFIRGDDCMRLAFDIHAASELMMKQDPIKGVLLKSYAEFFMSCKST